MIVKNVCSAQRHYGILPYTKHSKVSAFFFSFFFRGRGRVQLWPPERRLDGSFMTL